MKKIGCLLILFAIGFLAYVLNPTKEEHIDNAYELIERRGMEMFGQGSTLHSLESEVGRERMIEFVKSFISVNNYVLFSLTQITINGEFQTIAVGFFGVFWGQDDLDKLEGLKESTRDFIQNGVSKD